ncbi:hypothetical protein M2336_001045 [Sphingobium sp. B1D7B]|nr:hypothetical protein [Sphingobium sp. B1D7B]
MRILDVHASGLKSFALMLTAGCIPLSSAFASEQASATITLIAIDNNGGPYVFLAQGSRTTKPPCATDDFWAISGPTTDNAKAILANIMTAKALGNRVQIIGTGTCDTDQPTREKVNFIIIL